MYDVAIIGGGPAGITAAIYAQRYNMTSIDFAKTVGGLVTENPYIENYPGLKKVDGAELAHMMREHAEELGAKVKQELVRKITKKGNKFIIESEWDTKVEASSVIIASGLKRRFGRMPFLVLTRRRFITWTRERTVVRTTFWR